MIKIDCISGWNNNTFAIVGALCALNDCQKIDETKCRKFLVFCCQQVWNLLTTGEKDFVNTVNSYLNGGPEQIGDICDQARLFFQDVLIQPSTVEGRYNAGRMALVAGVGMCPNQRSFIIHRTMNKSAKEVMFLQAVDQLKQGPVFIKPTNDQILEIGRSYAIDQVAKIKELFSNPFA